MRRTRWTTGLLLSGLLFGIFPGTGRAETTEDDAEGGDLLWATVFLSPGATFTRHGVGLELTLHRMNLAGMGVGALVQYEHRHSILNIGGQVSYAIFLLEVAHSQSNGKAAAMLAPTLTFPIPIPVENESFQLIPVLNVFYRFYSGYDGLDSWGMSFKFAFPIKEEKH